MPLYPNHSLALFHPSTSPDTLKSINSTDNPIHCHSVQRDTTKVKGVGNVLPAVAAANMSLKRSASSSSDDEEGRLSKRRPTDAVSVSVGADASDSPSTLIQAHLQDLTAPPAEGAQAQIQAQWLQAQMQAQGQFRSSSLASALTAPYVSSGRTSSSSYTSAASASSSISGTGSRRTSQQEQLQYLLVSGHLPPSAANMALAGLAPLAAPASAAQGGGTGMFRLEGEARLATRLAEQAAHQDATAFGLSNLLSNYSLLPTASLAAAASNLSSYGSGITSGAGGLPLNWASTLLGGGGVAAVAPAPSLSPQVRAAQLLALQAEMNALRQGGTGPRMGQQQQQYQNQHELTFVGPHGHAAVAAALASTNRHSASSPELTGMNTASFSDGPVAGHPGHPTDHPTKEEVKAATGGSPSRAKKTKMLPAKPAPPKETTLAVAGVLPPALPPAVQGATPHYSERLHISLATDEDQNWLSEFQVCYDMI